MSSTQTETKMKALHYDGPFKVSVKEIELPKIEHPDDCIVKVTTSGMSYSWPWFPSSSETTKSQAEDAAPLIRMSC